MSHVRHNMHTQAAAAAAMPFLTVTVGSRQFYTLLGWYNPPYSCLAVLYTVLATVKRKEA